MTVTELLLELRKLNEEEIYTEYLKGTQIIAAVQLNSSFIR